MSNIDAQKVMQDCGVKTDISGKWVSKEEVQKLIAAVVNKCADVADKNSYCHGAAIKKEFNLG